MSKARVASSFDQPHPGENNHDYLSRQQNSLSVDAKIRRRLGRHIQPDETFGEALDKMLEQLKIEPDEEADLNFKIRIRP